MVGLAWSRVGLWWVVERAGSGLSGLRLVEGVFLVGSGSYRVDVRWM